MWMGRCLLSSAVVCGVVFCLPRWGQSIFFTTMHANKVNQNQQPIKTGLTLLTLILFSRSRTHNTIHNEQCTQHKEVKKIEVKR